MLQRLFPIRTPTPCRSSRRRRPGQPAPAPAPARPVSRRILSSAGAPSAPPRAGVYELSVPIKGDPTGPAAIAAVRQLRARTDPRGRSPVVGLRSMSGAIPRTTSTTSTRSPVRRPYVLTFVLALSFVVLLLALPLGRRRARLDRAEPALGRRCLWVLTLVLRPRCRSWAVRLRSGALDRSLGAAVPVLGAVRSVDGLPGLPDEPHQRTTRRGRLNAERRHLRCGVDRSHHHRRSADHHRRVHRLRQRPARHVPADGIRRSPSPCCSTRQSSARSCYPACSSCLASAPGTYPRWLHWLPDLSVEQRRTQPARVETPAQVTA